MSDEQVAELNLIKKIVGGVGGLIMMQLFGAMWWASSVATNLEYIKVDISALKAQGALVIVDRYTATDAKRDGAAVDMKIRDLQNQIATITDRMLNYNKNVVKGNI